MERPALDLVLQALDALFRNDDLTEKEKASAWLTRLQASVHAWEVADQLLALKRDTETSYFAAQTMASKVRTSFDELPANTHLALRDSLLHHLATLSTAPLPIVRQLAIALADLALQMEGWNTVVSDVIQRFSSDAGLVSVLLSILIVLPEEIGARSLRLGSNRRQGWRKLMAEDCTLVLSLLATCITTFPSDLDLHVKVYACIGSWVQLGKFPGDEFAHSELLASPFGVLKMLNVPHQLFEAAADCICATLYMCENSSQYGSLPQVLRSSVEGLLPVYQASVQAEDTDRAYCLCRIFTEMLESFLYHTVHQPTSDLGDPAMYNLLLECVCHPDYEVADITFNAWYRLSEELFKANDSSLTQLYKPYIERLISGLCVHCQMEEDTAQDCVPDDRDDFAEFRKSVVELIRDCVFVVGSLNCFSNLYQIICDPVTPWHTTEACLFVMHAVAPSIREDESEVLPIAVPVLLSIPPDAHLAIRAGTLRLVAELAEWIDHHPDTLDLVLQFILDGLRVVAIATLAAKAVQSVCQKCRHRMAPHFRSLVQIIEAAETLGLSNEAICGLLKGAAEVLSRMPHDQITPWFRHLCSLQSAPLLKITQESVTHPSKAGSHGDPCVWVDRLTALFRSCIVRDLGEGECNPCYPVMEELWPLLSELCTKHKESVRVIERICRCLRFMLRNVQRAAISLLSPLVTLAASVYHQHHHSCFLYLGSIVIDEFGGEESCRQGLLQMLQVFSEDTFPLLSSPGGLVSHPDIVDDLFRLCYRFIQQCPLTFLCSPMASPLIECALAACTLNHRDAFSSVMRFFKDIVACVSTATDTHQRELHFTAVQSLLTQHGQALVNGLVSGFVLLPTYMLMESSEVLWELLVCAREPVCHMLEVSIDSVSCSNAVKATDAQKAEFLTSISRCTALEDIFPVVREFARLYR